MKCMYCQGRLEQGVTPFHIDRKGYHLTLDEVPARICRQCGEVLFEEDAVKFIQSVLSEFGFGQSKLCTPLQEKFCATRTSFLK
ncbi:MAG: YgiT-type zinc finger protein [Desulfobacterales bacterium]|nr:YgiT-type zinc finger protein [Desulfobacterales bacterium]